MNAVDYVKQNGIEKARFHLEKMKAERWINSFFNDLKQIVDAFELVDKHGGMVNANTIAWKLSKAGLDTQADQMRKAINLVEKLND